MSTAPLDMDTLKARLKATWMAGDYGHFAQYLEPGALEFLARHPFPAGTRLLDVACGAGQIALPLTRAGVNVTGVDLAANLVEQARRRAAEAGLTIQFDEGDAEDLPYPAESFDVVVSLIGAMFAPRPERVAAELVRVCKRGGRIIMGNWTPAGFIGQMFKVMGKHVPPPAIMPSPLKWGDEVTVRERLEPESSSLQMTTHLYPFAYPFAPAEVVEFFRTYYGPTNRSFATLDANAQAALRNELVQLWSDHNLASDGTTRITSEYLEVVMTRR